MAAMRVARYAVPAVIAGALLCAPVPLSAQPAGLDGAHSGTDPYLAPSGNGGYDVEHYDVRLKYDPANHGIADARVQLTNRAQHALASFTLDARPGLVIDHVSVNGAKSRFEHQGRKLHVDRFGRVDDGNRFTVTVRYHGKPRPVRDPSGRELYGWLRTPGGSVTYTEPTGTSAWLPSNDVFYDKATWDTTIITPAGRLGVSTGKLQDIRTRKGRTTSSWSMNTPIQPYTQVVAIDRFAYSTAPIAGIPAFTAVAEGSFISVKAMRQRTAESIQWLQQRLGRYPFETTGGIVVSGGDSAMETAGRPTYSPDPYYTSRGTVLHEQAHQWFGNTVTAGNAADIWLHEGFATYLENVATADRRGTSLDDLVHGQYVNDGWSPGYHGQFQKVPLSDPTSKYLLNTTPYFRGQAALHALRAELGERDFWRVMRALAQEPPGRTSDTDAILAEAEQVSGRSLTGWADTWLHSTGYQQLPVAPSHRAVLREIGPGLLDAASDWVWRPQGSATKGLKAAVRSYAPMNHLVINSVTPVRDGRRLRYYVDFQTRSGALYPQDYRTCFVFEKHNNSILAGAYLGIRISDDYQQNRFTLRACPSF